jgi:hypothetical protein
MVASIIDGLQQTRMSRTPLQPPVNKITADFMLPTPLAGSKSPTADLPGLL